MGLDDLLDSLDLEEDDFDSLIDTLHEGAVESLLTELGGLGDAYALPEEPIELARIVEPRFATRAHLEFLSAQVADALRDVEQGKSRRIILEMPPRSGKTLLGTMVTAAWALARHPDWSIALTSHDSSLAVSWGRTIRRWAERGLLGRQVEISQDSKAASEWETTEGGTVLSRSVRESLTGRGAKIFLIDDPVKDFIEAHSKTVRDSVWNWWLSVAQTRLEPPSLVIVTMCMTGDTPVMRPNGTETPLRDIRPEDEIATYEDGNLTTSKVLNWANQGPDDIFEIRLESGRTVRANARHPFLTVDDEGNEIWRRTDQLVNGSKVLSVEGPGRALSAQRPDATSPSVARDSVPRTTTSTAGRRGTDRPRSIQSHGERPASRAGTESLWKSSMLWWRSKADAVRSAASSLMIALRLTGQESSASTTTTKREKYEGCSATIATSYSRSTSTLTDSEPPLTTWSITPDTVVSVTPAGREDVFDLQVERTENFIANGLVSHNTRWHEDDIVGRLQSREYPGNPNDWTVIRMPALAEKNDPLGRAEGEPIISPIVNETPSQSLERWKGVKESVGSYTWAAMYQQRPAPAEGAIFSVEWWKFWTTDPAKVTEDGRVILLPSEQELRRATFLDSWDTSFKGTDTSDWVVGQRWARLGARRFLLAQLRGRWSFTEALKQMEKWAETEDPALSPYGHLVHKRLIEDSANGPAIIDKMQEKVSGIKAIRAKNSKESRARAITPEIESGHVILPHPTEPGFEWVTDLTSEVREFPNGAHDDQVDALTQALLELRDTRPARVSVPRGTIDRGVRGAASLRR